MQLKIVFTVLLLSFVFYSCNKKKHSHSINNITTINITETDRPQGELLCTNIDALFDSIEFVKLETYQECLIGNIDKIEYYQNNFYILDKNITRTLFCYSRQGSFNFKIHNEGKGPGEYISIVDFTIDHSNNKIQILDFTSQKILTFNLDGKFISEKKCNENTVKHIHSEKNLSYFDMGTNSGKYNILCYEQNKKAGSFFKLNKLLKDMPGSFDSRFCRSSEKTYYNPLLSDTIYQIDSIILEPKYYIDFGKQKIDIKRITSNSNEIEKINSVLNQDACQLNPMSYHTTKYVYLSFLKGRFPVSFHVFYNKEHNKLWCSNIVYAEKKAALNFIPFPKGVLEDAFYGDISSSSVKDIYDNFNSIQKQSLDQSIRDICITATEYNNPIIVIYK